MTPRARRGAEVEVEDEGAGLTRVDRPMTMNTLEAEAVEEEAARPGAAEAVVVDIETAEAAGGDGHPTRAKRLRQTALTP